MQIQADFPFHWIIITYTLSVRTSISGPEIEAHRACAEMALEGLRAKVGLPGCERPSRAPFVRGELCGALDLAPIIV